MTSPKTVQNIHTIHIEEKYLNKEFMTSASQNGVN